MIVSTVSCRNQGKLPMDGTVYLNTTVKSGELTFAPSWKIVRGHQLGAITDSEYTEEFILLMRESFRKNKQRWLEVARMDKVALACYCPPNSFCHRLLLVDIFRKICQAHEIPFEYIGEVV